MKNNMKAKGKRGGERLHRTQGVGRRTQESEGEGAPRTTSSIPGRATPIKNDLCICAELWNCEKYE